ncbi:nSTAND1 domain-containing NTPase [Streptosporangium saharense]|uniref:nSTAND1 domain-containing NTPase n=1 Tax=Streptosporangium saharense TaxID=1706840 RepID=UPI003439369D
MAELDDGADGVVATVIIDTYPGAPEGMRNRPLLEKSAADFVELAAALGFRASHCDLSGSGEDRGARRAISDGFGRLDQHPATRKIVYWTGHGKMLGREFYLVPSDGHRDGVAQPELSFNVTTVAQMVSRLSGEVLLILDACFSATALDEVTRIIRSMGRQVDERGRMAGFAVVATAEAEAGSGEWVRCLQQVMGNRLFRQPNEDKPLFMRTERYIGVGDLLEALSASTGWTRGSQVQGWQEIHPLSRTFLRNPYFSESMRRAVRPQGDESWIGDELRKDVMRPFSGTSDLWSIRDFTGRTASVRRIVTWLGTRSRGMFVVTGPSGSGKSALLSYVAHLTIPEFYERLRVKPPLYLQPDLHSIHAAVHCRGKTISGLVNELAARLRPLGLEGDSFATSEEFTAAVARMAELKGALTLLVDGLDEAATGQSFEIARDLLNRLAACPAIKVVVGTRYLPRQLPAGYHVTETLVEVLHTSEEPLAIDEDPGTDTDIHRYVDHVLRSEGSPYRTADDERAHACASLTVRSHGLFIIASMWAHHLARQSERPALNRLDSDIGSGLAELNSLMAEEVRRLDPIDPERTQDLLRPLALAQGAGLPCSQVWLEIANALRAGSRAPYTYKELRRVVHGTVKTLVSMENEDGRDLYRLHHLSFGAHLLPREEDQPELHRRIVDVLRPSRHGDGNGTWEKADPYIKNQMAAHAAAAGDEVLDELTSDLDFLVNADPAGVLPLVGNASQVSEPLQLYLRVVTRFARLGVRERWALMRATALRSHPELLHEMRPYETSRLPWDDVWTDAPPEPVYRTLVGPFGGAHAVTWTDAGGNLVLASGISEIRAWHASSGHVAWTLQRWADASSGGGATGEEGPLSAIGMIDDTPVVVAADARALLLWSTSFSRRPQRMFWGGDVKSVSVTSKGADAYAAALEGDMLWVWHWPLNAQSQPRRIHHVRLSGPARAVRLVPLAGALIAVIGGRGRVELREVTKGARNHAPLGFLETGTVSVDDVAVLSEPDGTAWIAAVGWQRLRVWRLRKLPFEENPLPVLDIVTSGRGIALGRGRGGILAAVKDGTEIRTWQMDGTEHVPLTHHDTMLKSIAFDPSGSGRLAAADGGSVRIWEPGDTTLQRAAVRSALHLLRVFPGTRDRHLLCRAEGPRVRISEHTMAGRSRRWSSEEVVLDHTPDKVAEISAVSLADNTWLIATAFRRTVRLWTVVNGEVTHRHEISLDGPRDDGIRAVALHTDGDMVQLFVPVHQRLRTYRLDTAENVWRPAESTASVTGAAMIEQIAVVACLDNEPYVVARAGASAYLWHGGPHPVSRIDVPIGPMSALGCGRSSVRPPLVAISVGSEIFLSEFRDGRRSAEPLARSATAVRSLALTGSSEHPLLVAGTGPSTVRLWDPIRRRPLLDIPDRGYLVEQVAAVTNHRGVTLFLAGKDRCDQLHLPTARIEALAHIENGEPHAL